MFRWATKDTYEREEEESERLVRPVPKVKPPRRDRRREIVDAEPSQEEEDKDRSLNYKDVGGSVLSRFLQGAKGKVKVIRKDTGETTYVKPETLKEKSNEYTLPEEGAEESWTPEDLAHHEKGKAVWEAAKDDPEFKSVLNNLLKPGSEAGELARRTPGFPVAPFVRGRKLPEGIENLGQLIKALEKGQKAPPKPKEEPKPAPGDELSAEEKTPDAPAGDTPVADGTPAAPGDEAKSEETPADEGPSSEKNEDSTSEKEKKGPPKGKIPEPERREPEEWELMAARSAILETLPRGEMRDRLLDARLHPDDVGEILAAYHTARAGEIGPKGAEKLIDEARRWYQSDPTKIGPPKFGKDQAGNEKPFAELLPEEQAKASVQHRNRTLALSLAAHDQVTRSLTKNLGAPPALADFLSAFMLGQKPPKDGETIDPLEEMEKSKTLAKKVFEKVFEEGEEERISPSAIKNVLDFTKSNPTAERAAVAYFQARDYQAARERYLSPDSPSHISEHQGPTDIARGIVEGSRFLVDRSRLYPPSSITQDPAGAFRNRVLQHIKTLTPEKYPFVRNHVDAYERQLYDAESERHEKLVERAMGRYQKDVQRVLDKHDKAVEKLRNRHEKTIDTFREESKTYDREYRKYVKEKIRHQKLVQKTLQEAQERGGDYRQSPTEGLPEPPMPPKAPVPPADIDLPDLPELPPEPILPEPPAKPARYGLVDDDLEEERERLWEEQKRQASSYSGRLSMDRQGVYWGVAPYPKGQEGFAPYPEWAQAHARDLGEQDFSAILKAAREWLRTPVLSKAIDGIEKDAQLRAALDLAIRTHDEGRYSAGLHPQLYNQLLARLAGKSEDETLMTVRGAIARDSVYVATRAGRGNLLGEGSSFLRTPWERSLTSHVTAGEKPMSASSEIRKFASGVAAAHPEVAYDLVGLADRLAEDEQQQAQQSQEQQSQEQKQAGEVPPQFLEHQKKKKEDEGKDQGQGEQQQKQAYRTLRAAVLNTAKANPSIRNALLPVLQTIKQFG